MIRLVVTGNNGQIAKSLLDRVPHYADTEVVALGRPQLDLERPDSLRAALASTRPDIIVSTAAYTAVDKAESEEARAMAVNCDGAAAVATAAESLGVPLVHLSTDYVFDGLKGLPYVEADLPNPVNAYGRSKLAGERAVRASCSGALVLRTSWVYSPFGNNFVKTMLRLGAERAVLHVVNDQWGTPTSGLELADALLSIAPRIVHDPVSGVFHAAGSDSTTWYELAVSIFRVAEESGRSTPEVQPIPTSAYPTPARRPRDSRLDSTNGTKVLGRSFGLPTALSTVVRRLI